MSAALSWSPETPSWAGQPGAPTHGGTRVSCRCSASHRNALVSPARRFGVRSLAKSHKKFGAGENYWRGAVWINCNYLALQVCCTAPVGEGGECASDRDAVLCFNTQALRHYSHVEGPAQERAAELRDECVQLRRAAQLRSRRPAPGLQCGLADVGACADFLGSVPRAPSHRLRANLVRTINDQYQAKGFLYESYDSDDGHGRGTHPFTGWTSLVVLMLADVY